MRLGDVLLDLGNQSRTASFDHLGNADFTGIPQTFLGQTIRLKPRVPGYKQKWYDKVISGNVIFLGLEPEETITPPQPPVLPVVKRSVSIPDIEIMDMRQPHLRLGESFSQKMSATGGRESYSWSLSDLPDRLKADLQIDPATGLIYGKPTEAVQYSFGVHVVDADHKSANRNFTITVVAPWEVFVELPESDTAPASREVFETVMEPCLARFLSSRQSGSPLHKPNFRCTECRASNQVQFELKSNANVVLWTDAFYKDAQLPAFDLATAMTDLCYGKLGVKKRYDFISKKLKQTKSEEVK
jgi:hypothetical protein